MKDRLIRSVIGRRDFLLGAAGIAACATLVDFGLHAFAQDAAPTIDDTLKKIIGDAKPVEGLITFDLPEIAENGNTVPYSFAVESPMTDSDYVKTVHVIATGNPNPEIASFAFTPLAGKAAAASRMRLAKTQDAMIVAEMSSGKFFMNKRNVKVTIGGCGG
jgi:sulfur-oxidizing protein SoxY